MYKGYVFTKPKYTGDKNGVCEKIPGTPGLTNVFQHGLAQHCLGLTVSRGISSFRDRAKNPDILAKHIITETGHLQEFLM